MPGTDRAARAAASAARTSTTTRSGTHSMITPVPRTGSTGAGTVVVDLIGPDVGKLEVQPAQVQPDPVGQCRHPTPRQLHSSDVPEAVAQRHRHPHPHGVRGLRVGHDAAAVGPHPGHGVHGVAQHRGQGVGRDVDDRAGRGWQGNRRAVGEVGPDCSHHLVQQPGGWFDRIVDEQAGGHGELFEAGAGGGAVRAVRRVPSAADRGAGFHVLPHLLHGAPAGQRVHALGVGRTAGARRAAGGAGLVRVHFWGSPRRTPRHRPTIVSGDVLGTSLGHLDPGGDVCPGCTGVVTASWLTASAFVSHDINSLLRATGI